MDLRKEINEINKLQREIKESLKVIEEYEKEHGKLKLSEEDNWNLADEIKNRLSEGFIYIDVLKILLKQRDQKVKEDIGEKMISSRRFKEILDKRAGKL